MGLCERCFGGGELTRFEAIGCLMEWEICVDFVLADQGCLYVVLLSFEVEGVHYWGYSRGKSA